jgi:hypothetical protein
MRALTIRQPWCAAITHGAKRTENRSWQLPARFVGVPVLLHAAAAADRHAVLCRGRDWPDVRGAIVATARFVGCHVANPTGVLCCAPWGFPDVYHWELADVRPLTEPVPVKGKLGFWTPTDDVLAAVEVQQTVEVA